MRSAVAADAADADLVPDLSCILVEVVGVPVLAVVEYRIDLALLSQQ